ncbi:hypothetical protein CLOSTHATH_06573 [Hungatella hathewayi DSM 13479]|uniref:Uncharacterized protein n=1 Tax=Hungatella hathewayi DSM 13479 TaxID=566550 RepID=D3ASG5_9FIRM|nr:hypothetical protein CLOSTHATH_06573 [Hungatella hathewayi DSM 13479]DAO33120.1 MAG TPA: hypothetical protein [Caudoviricetes sp.]
MIFAPPIHDKWKRTNVLSDNLAGCVFNRLNGDCLNWKASLSYA